MEEEICDLTKLMGEEKYKEIYGTSIKNNKDIYIYNKQVDFKITILLIQNIYIKLILVFYSDVIYMIL